MSDPFRVMCADPPWPTHKSLLGAPSAADHYALMSLDEIKVFPRPPMRDDAVLFMWRLSSMIEDAYDVIREWGFTAKTEIVWVKMTKHGKRHFGPGRYLKGQHETCIVATCGKYQFRRHNVRSTFEAPVTRHSAKPEIFYTDIVPQLVDGPYVELFGRNIRPGWTVLGKEVPA